MIIGKPKDAEDAVRILSMLSGKTHRVFTGVSVIADILMKAPPLSAAFGKKRKFKPNAAFGKKRKFKLNAAFREKRKFKLNAALRRSRLKLCLPTR